MICSYSGELFMFIFTLFLMVFALYAKRNELMVSSMWDECMEQATSKVVLKFPPRDSLRRRVSFESL